MQKLAIETNNVSVKICCRLGCGMEIIMDHVDFQLERIKKWYNIMSKIQVDLNGLNHLSQLNNATDLTK